MECLNRGRRMSEDCSGWGELCAAQFAVAFRGSFRRRSVLIQNYCFL